VCLPVCLSLPVRAKPFNNPHAASSQFATLQSAAGSPSDRPLHQHRFADGAWRRRTGGSSHQGGNDDRELFVGNLAAEVTNEDLVRIFSEFGPLKSVGIAKDSTSGACKGFGFLCFQQPELAETVLESPRLFTLYGRVLRVDWRLKNPGHHGNHTNRRLSSSSGCIGSPRQYNYQQVQLGANLANTDDASVLPSVDDDEAANGGCGLNGDCQLFVGNLASDVTQGDLRQYFRRWGELLYCYVIRDEDGQSKRYGFITFKDPKVAEQLMQSRSSHVLKGKRLRFEMPKRSREEAFSLRQQDASSSSATSTPKTSPGAPTTPASTKLSQQQVVSPEQNQS
uniref:RNA-binding protein n=1 Tax=Macrostomum lignano TaxID=282301 RepID=A0A1I8GQH8_9PLAT